MIEMLRIYSKGFLENVTIEKLTPRSFSDKFAINKIKCRESENSQNWPFFTDSLDKK